MATTMRRRLEFEAEILSPTGDRLSGCYVFIDVETEVGPSDPHVRWYGKFTSLSDPSTAFDGVYRLRPTAQDAPSEIDVIHGATDRLGITSDEYQFRGLGPAPRLP